MINISVPHQVDDLQLMINLCTKLIKESIDFIDYTDYYNIQSYCKKLRAKKENNFRPVRLKARAHATIAMNINECRSLEKLYDLHCVYFKNTENIYQMLLITGILEPYMKFKINHIYNPF